MSHTAFSILARRTLTSALLCAALPLLAHQAPAPPEVKSVVPESLPAFQAMNQWLTTHVLVLPEPASMLTPKVQAWQEGASGERAFEAHPVIVGAPELPLQSASATRRTQLWDSTLNYQGVHMSLLVLDAVSGRLVQRPLSYLLTVGERFKIRITPTFDAVTELDQLVGGAWRSHRTGQAYPAAGTSVAIQAGQTVDLPLGGNLLFGVDGKTPNERMVISVRHPQALRDAASSQPNYRQENPRGSSYLQLVPPGKFPIIEQVISVQVR